MKHNEMLCKSAPLKPHASDHWDSCWTGDTGVWEILSSSYFLTKFKLHLICQDNKYLFDLAMKLYCFKVF